MEELLRLRDSLSCPPRSQPLILLLHPPASPWQKAFHPLGSTCLHTQLGPQLAREYRVPLQSKWASALPAQQQLSVERGLLLASSQVRHEGDSWRSPVVLSLQRK